jgi:hypothetical protein
VASATVEAGLEEALAADDAVTVRVALEMVRSAVMSMAPAEGLEQVCACAREAVSVVSERVEGELCVCLGERLCASCVWR